MSKEILLVSPPYPTAGRRATPPLGLAVIAGYLEEHGYRDRVEILDGFWLATKIGYEKSLEKIGLKIRSEKPLLVGCPVLYTNEEEAMMIINAAKDAGSHVVVGNHTATFAHEQYARLASVVIRREGEAAMKEVADALLGGGGLGAVKGITYFDGKKVVVNPDRGLVDLDGLPVPAFHLLPSPSEYGPMLVEESRGCCFRCTFCSIARLHYSYRMKSPERIHSEVKRIVELGGRDVELVGELVLFDEKRALRIADSMGSLGCGWKIDAHPRLVVKQKSILPLLRERGLRVVETGVESGNRQSLQLFNKDTTPEINEQAIDYLSAAGIFPLIDFINFEPYMSMKDLEENIRFIMRHLRLLSRAPSYPLENAFKPWVPIPGTALYDKVAKDELIVTAGLGAASSYLKMTNARHGFRFRNRLVKEVTDLIDYFLLRHGERYQRLLEEGSGSGPGMASGDDVRTAALAVLPAYVLCMAFAVVENGLAYGRMIIDWYSEGTLDSMKKGEYEQEPAPLDLPGDAWQRIHRVFQRLGRSN